jgi:hypothetical protein
LPFLGKAATTILANGTTSLGCSISDESATTVTLTPSASGPATTVTATLPASAGALCDVQSSAIPSGAIAGLAVLGAVSLLSIGWALWENHARRRQGQTISNSGSGQVFYGRVGQGPQFATPGSGSYTYKHEMEAPRAAAEMDGGNRTMIMEM